MLVVAMTGNYSKDDKPLPAHVDPNRQFVEENDVSPENSLSLLEIACEKISQDLCHRNTNITKLFADSLFSSSHAEVPTSKSTSESHWSAEMRGGEPSRRPKKPSVTTLGSMTKKRNNSSQFGSDNSLEKNSTEPKFPLTILSSSYGSASSKYERDVKYYLNVINSPTPPADRVERPHNRSCHHQNTGRDKRNDGRVKNDNNFVGTSSSFASSVRRQKWLNSLKMNYNLFHNHSSSTSRPNLDRTKQIKQNIIHKSFIDCCEKVSSQEKLSPKENLPQVKKHCAIVTSITGANSSPHNLDLPGEITKNSLSTEIFEVKASDLGIFPTSACPSHVEQDAHLTYTQNSHDMSAYDGSMFFQQRHYKNISFQASLNHFLLEYYRYYFHYNFFLMAQSSKHLQAPHTPSSDKTIINIDKNLTYAEPDPVYLITSSKQHSLNINRLLSSDAPKTGDMSISTSPKIHKYPHFPPCHNKKWENTCDSLGKFPTPYIPMPKTDFGESDKICDTIMFNKQQPAQSITTKSPIYLHPNRQNFFKHFDHKHYHPAWPLPDPYGRYRHSAQSPSLFHFPPSLIPQPALPPPFFPSPYSFDMAHPFVRFPSAPKNSDELYSQSASPRRHDGDVFNFDFLPTPSKKFKSADL